MTSDVLVQLAKKLAPSMAATLRIGVITSLVGDKATTDVTGAALVTMNSDSKLAVGDRVLLLQQRSVWIVAFRLSGSYQPPAVQTPVGSMVAWPSTTLPSGWLECDGTAVSRSTYAALFAVCGTTYGAGNGSTTFNLPNLAGRFPVGEGNGRSPGASGGSETVTLTVAQMPAHSHLTERGGLKNIASGTGDNVIINSATERTRDTGGGEAHPNMPPYLTVMWIVRAL